MSLPTTCILAIFLASLLLSAALNLTLPHQHPDPEVVLQDLRRSGEQEDAVKESKNFLISSLSWSIALLGVKDLLLNEQATFILIAIALIVLFCISSRIARSNDGKKFINFAFLILGCFVVGVAINFIVLNSYIKWAIYSLFLVMVATDPNHQQIYQDMKGIFKSMCGKISLKFKNLFIQLKEIMKKLMKINVADEDKSSTDNNVAAQAIGGGGGGGVGENIV